MNTQISSPVSINTFMPTNSIMGGTVTGGSVQTCYHKNEQGEWYVFYPPYGRGDHLRALLMSHQQKTFGFYYEFKKHRKLGPVLKIFRLCEADELWSGHWMASNPCGQFSSKEELEAYMQVLELYMEWTKLFENDASLRLDIQVESQGKRGWEGDNWYVQTVVAANQFRALMADSTYIVD